MSERDPDLLRNAEATRSLGHLVARLDGADLARSLGGGWTVAFALAHLAFWDARQDAALRVYARGEALPPEDEVTNTTLETIAGIFDSNTVASLTVEAAEGLDAAAIDLTAGQLTALREAGQEYAFRRWPHREEHIAQIEGVLD